MSRKRNCKPRIKEMAKDGMWKNYGDIIINR
jgi:hypothetical protein